jgi:hypothetical protein
MRARTVLALGVTAAALIAATAASAATFSYSDGPLTATFSVGTNHPNCKQKWPVTVTATVNGRPAHATAFYQFLSNNQLVGTQYPFSGTSRNPSNTKYHFFGSFTDNGFGPLGALAVGQQLYVRAVVQVGSHTAYPGDKNVQVVSARGCPPK